MSSGCESVLQLLSTEPDPQMHPCEHSVQEIGLLFYGKNVPLCPDASL
jgi:hypothetical protein